MNLSTIDHILWLLSGLLPVVVIIRIVYQRLYVPPFDAFALMLGVVVGRDVVLACLHYGSLSYTIAWEFSLPVILVSQIYAGLQVFISITRIYPRFGSSGIRLFSGCLAMTAGCCSTGLPFEHRYLWVDHSILRSFFLAQRWVDGCLAGTLILACIVLIRSTAPPRQPSANLVLHTSLLTIYFTGYAVLFFLENLAPLGAMQKIERVQFSVVVLLYVLWATRLSLKGQRNHRWPDISAILFRNAEKPSFPPSYSIGRYS